jgi:hypothetical protein
MIRRSGWLLGALAMAGGLLVMRNVVSARSMRMSISMERSGSQYVLRFKAGGQDAAVRALYISILEGDNAAGTICEWGAQFPVHPFVGKWIYRDALPTEYESKGCPPLDPGRYRVQAIGFGGGAILNVQIDSAGEVQALK